MKNQDTLIEAYRQLLKGHIELHGSVSRDFIDGLVDGFMITMAVMQPKWRKLFASNEEFEALAAELTKHLVELAEMLEGKEGHGS